MESDTNIIKTLWIGFDYSQIDKYIQENPEINKIVIFDSATDDSVRESFQKLYNIYKEKVTLYDGCIVTNINGYLKLHQFNNITYTWKGNLMLLSDA